MAVRRKIRNAKRSKWEGRRRRVQRMFVHTDRPRLVVFRSAKHIYAQLVDAATGRTLMTISTRTPSVVGEGQRTGNRDAAKKVGAAIAAAARERKIERVVFNRNGFLYHGRVKALAEAAREAGLQF